MTQCLFIRNTHDRNGRARPLSPEAWQFWQQQGHMVGSVLRHETPLPLPPSSKPAWNWPKNRPTAAPTPKKTSSTWPGAS
jgi:hypothetical protein